MSGSNFTIYGPGERGHRGMNSRPMDGSMPRRLDPSELDAQRIRDLEEHLRALGEEPMLVATVVEVRDDRMMVAIGPVQLLDICRIDGARVGSRVLLHRNTSQAIEVVEEHAGERPAGFVVVVQRQDGAIIEAELQGMTRAFRVSGGAVFTKGERAIVDASMQYVIGSLGKPPQLFSHAPRVAVSWEDVGGHLEAKAALQEAIELPFAHPELFRAYGKTPVKGVLLSGPSGTGKTLLAKAAATSIARAHGRATASGFAYVKGPELLNAYIGRTEEAVRQLFSAARDHKREHGYPAVIFLDECDALLGVRDHTSKLSLNATTVPQFLAEMDGLDDAGAMLILATNRPELLDPAVVREGRIDRRVRVGRPSESDAAAIAEIHLRDRPLSELSIKHAALAIACSIFDVDREPIATYGDKSVRLSDFASGALIAGVIERATTCAMMRDIATGGGTASGIKFSDLDESIAHAARGLRHVNHAEILHEKEAA